MNTSSQQILSVQYLRGFAAALIIVHHALDQFPGFKQALSFTGGGAGVDMFFAISGFVMTYTAAVHGYGAKEFLLRRIVRIVPLYWMITLFTAALLLFGSFLVRNSVFSLGHLIASLLFFPVRNPADYGSITPVLKLGWTLNYEMFFYLVFAAFLSYGPRTRTTLMALLFAALCLAARLIPASSVPLTFWGDPIVFEFLFGCVLADFYLSGVLQRIPRSLLVVAGWAGAATIVVFGFGAFLAADPLDLRRLLTFGLPAALIVASFVGLEQTTKVQKEHPLLHFIGDASYSIYLTHLFVVIFMRIVWSRFGLPTDGVAWTLLFVAVCFAGGIGLGCLTYVAVEKRATAWAKVLLVRKDTRRLPAVP